MSNLERAVGRVLRSLRRKAAGEHAVDVDTLVSAWASEWCLTAFQESSLRYRARSYEAELKAKTGGQPRSGSRPSI